MTPHQLRVWVAIQQHRRRQAEATKSKIIDGNGYAIVDGDGKLILAR